MREFLPSLLLYASRVHGVNVTKIVNNLKLVLLSPAVFLDILLNYYLSILCNFRRFPVNCLFKRVLKNM